MPTRGFISTAYRNRFVKLSYLVLVAFLAATSPAFFIGRTSPDWAPEPLRNLAFDMQLLAGTPAKKAASLYNGFTGDMRIYFDIYGKNVFFTSENLVIAGTLYLPNEEGIYPGIVLVHGSSPEGRNLGLYRVLGKEIAQRGYAVLSIDMRGYGESEKPPQTGDVSAFDFPADIAAAAAYLSSLENVREDLFVLGHSAGADQAIRAGITDDRITKIIALGPSRRVKERYGDVDKPEYDYFKRRVEKYMSLPEPIPDEVFLQMVRHMDIAQYASYFSSQAHKPLLLIDGALEDPADIDFLQEFYAGIIEPKKYVHLGGSDHYANTSNWGPFIIYDENVLSTMVNEIDHWLTE
jgi:pimeloyl-ACP methyl ester carboxylesterase